MTTVGAANIHNVAIRGTFDDCRDLVKASFADDGLRHDVGLAAVNSIKLGPGGGPDRVLRHVGSAGPTGRRPGVVRRSQRQLRQRPGRLVRQADGPGRRSPGRGQQPQRCADPLLRDRPAGDPGRRAVAQPQHGHPGLVQLRAGSCGRRPAATAEAVAALLADLRRVGSVEVPAAWREVIDADFVGARLDDDGTIDRIAATPRRHRARRRPPHRGRAGRSRPVRPARHTDDQPGHRRSRQVPRRRRAGPSASAPRSPPHAAEILDKPERYEVLDNDPSAVTELLRAIAGQRAQ